MTTAIVEVAVKNGDKRIALGIMDIVHATVSEHGSLEFSNPCRENRVGASDLPPFIGRGRFVPLFDRN
ncbi:hypothetical protein [Neorhizobium sp. JUb45]|uniref:hypothetical protein n=1 Tax=unclassified Neorhizobium TaxID=2629175 RepID=UPI0010517B19|nr:hypothetical protein [Neorhizobium sp. JUb45]TCR07102.1 hypothetical protein EDF70_1011068 [Neorhizobium sp. JUb45]